MIRVTGLDGTTWYLNYFQILCIEQIPETKIMLNNKQYYLVKDSVESIQEQIVAFLHSCVSPEERAFLWEHE